MPVATITQTTDKFDLKTLPGAFVVIRRMTYGEKLSQQDNMLRMNFEGKNRDAQMELLRKQSTLWEFANLIVEHNLTDEKENILNFKNIADVNRLDPKIGSEIEELINSMNSFEETEEGKN